MFRPHVRVLPARREQVEFVCRMTDVLDISGVCCAGSEEEEDEEALGHSVRDGLECAIVEGHHPLGRSPHVSLDGPQRPMEIPEKRPDAVESEYLFLLRSGVERSAKARNIVDPPRSWRHIA